MEELNFITQFTDLTLNEACGEFSEVERLMLEENVPSNKWVVRSDMLIIRPTGICKIICNFFHNRKVYIAEYLPSGKDFFNDDIGCLNRWCSNHGWETPEPTPPMLQTWPDFWKHLWETHIIDSEIMDAKFGKRIDILSETEISDAQRENL